MKTRKKMIMIRATPQEVRVLKRLARQEGKSMAALVRERVIWPGLTMDPSQGIFDAIFAGNGARKGRK